MIKFKIPIGDWSDDGHGRCDYFYATTDKTLQDVREAHFLIREKTGIDVEKICSEYLEYRISKDGINSLKDLGFDFENTENEEDEDGQPLSSEDCCKIWVFLLNRVDSGLNVKLTPDVEMLVFYGYDEKGRHISCPGYGCFE